MEATARLEEGCSVGERWWPESGKGARFGHLGPSLLACVDEERQGDAVKLRDGSVDLGDGRRRRGRGGRRTLVRVSRGIASESGKEKKIGQPRVRLAARGDLIGGEERRRASWRRRRRPRATRRCFLEWEVEDERVFCT
jgi:hypothetical protein